MKHNLHVWLIGGQVIWKDDYACIEITRTKTAALRIAENRLAYAAFDWEKHGKRCKENFKKPVESMANSNRKYGGNWDKYVDAVMAGNWHTDDKCYIHSFSTLCRGITIIEPDGNIIRIATPNPKLVAERIAKEKKWEKQTNQLVSGLCESLKKVKP
jgi:hypothetical protein